VWPSAGANVGERPHDQCGQDNGGKPGREVEPARDGLIAISKCRLHDPTSGFLYVAHVRLLPAEHSAKVVLKLVHH
jgi:hypothetical protein